MADPLKGPLAVLTKLGFDPINTLPMHEQPTSTPKLMNEFLIQNYVPTAGDVAQLPFFHQLHSQLPPRKIRPKNRPFDRHAAIPKKSLNSWMAFRGIRSYC
jgi:hypothetical protein